MLITRQCLEHRISKTSSMGEAEICDVVAVDIEASLLCVQV